MKKAMIVFTMIAVLGCAGGGGRSVANSIDNVSTGDRLVLLGSASLEQIPIQESDKSMFYGYRDTSGTLRCAINQVIPSARPPARNARTANVDYYYHRTLQATSTRYDYHFKSVPARAGDPVTDLYLTCVPQHGVSTLAQAPTRAEINALFEGMLQLFPPQAVEAGDDESVPAAQ